MTLTLLGHSWAHGQGATRPDGGFGALVAARLGLGLRVLAVRGSDTAHTLAVAREHDLTGQTVVVMAGLNDARLHGTGRVAAYAERVRGIVAACAGSRTLWVLQPPLADYAGFPPHDRGSDAAVAAHDEAVRASGVAYATVRGWRPAEHLAPDGVHPGDAGHALIADAVAAALAEVSAGRRDAARARRTCDARARRS